MSKNIFAIDSKREKIDQFTSSLNNECNIQFEIEENIADSTMKV